MCKHEEIELIARIENFQRHRSINLYSCRSCNSTVVMKNRSTPVILNGEFRNKKAHRLAI